MFHHIHTELFGFVREKDEHKDEYKEATMGTRKIIIYCFDKERGREMVGMIQGPLFQDIND